MLEAQKKYQTRNKKNRTNLEIYLDSKYHSDWKEVTPYLITFDVNYKEDVFGLEEFEIVAKPNVTLVCLNSGKILYKDKIETKFSKSKYLYIKHLSESNTLHFQYHKCELKLVNNVTSSIKFFQESSHKENNFASKICIHIIPEPRRYKYYNYFDFFSTFSVLPDTQIDL